MSVRNLDDDNIPPIVPTGLAISPDTGTSATDGLTNTGNATLSGLLDQAGLTYAERLQT